MSDVVLLDGAIGQELVHRSKTPPDRLWSTRVMMGEPGLAGEVHTDYFRAGATIATANTYALHRSRLEPEGLDGQLGELVATAMEQAARARDAHGSGRIAWALGPLLASYRPDLKPDPALAEARFGELADMMADRANLFLIETVCSVQEAEGALRGTRNRGKPVWIAFSVMDSDGTRLRSGEPLGDVLPTVNYFDPAAVLINCTRPEAVPAALEVLKTFGRPFGAYANGFTRISEAFLTEAPTVDVLDQRADLGPAAYAEHALGWVAQGAAIVGGCCEIGPAHIAELARRLTEAGHRIV